MLFQLMYYIIFILLFVLLPRRTYPQMIDDHVDIDIVTKHIVGGTLVDDIYDLSSNDNNNDNNRYPFYGHSGSIKKMCGATLIHVDILVTAAHCMNAFIENGIYINTTTLRIGGQWYRVLNEIQHPLYPKATLTMDESYDIMLLQIEIILSNNTTTTTTTTKDGDNDIDSNKYVELNFNPSIPQDTEELTIIGFGDTLIGSSKHSYNLLQVNVQTINSNDCKDSYGYIPNTNNTTYYVNTTYMVCNGSLNYTIGGQDSCQGDSGGPVLLSTSTTSSTNTKKYTQIGIVSFGKGCALPNTSSVNTRVSAYQRWITLGICIVSLYPPSTCHNLTNDDYQYFWGNNDIIPNDINDNNANQLIVDDNYLLSEYQLICYICNNTQNATIMYPYNTIEIPSNWFMSSLTSTTTRSSKLLNTTIMNSTTTTNATTTNTIMMNISCLQLYWNSKMGLYTKLACWNIQYQTKFQKVCGCTSITTITGISTPIISNNKNNTDYTTDDEGIFINDDIEYFYDDEIYDDPIEIYHDNSGSHHQQNNSTGNSSNYNNHSTITNNNNNNNNSICYICNGNSQYRINPISYNNTIIYKNYPYTCYDLEQLGLNQFMDNIVCFHATLYITFINTQINEVNCPCQLVTNYSNSINNTTIITPTGMPCYDSVNNKTTATASLCNNISSNKDTESNTINSNTTTRFHNDNNNTNNNTSSSSSSLHRIVIISITNIIWLYQSFIIIIIMIL